MNVSITEVCRQVNAIEFEEYSNTGWLKALPMTDEGFGAEVLSSASAAERSLLNRFRRAPDNVEIQKELIRLFLSEYILCRTPESICAGSADIDDYVNEPRSAALQVVDLIVARSLENEKTRQLSPENGGIDYLQLRDRFASDLFPDSTYFYVRRQPPSFIEKYGFTEHDVIGISPLAIGMFWIE